MLFYFCFVDVVFIVSEEFFEVFTQEDFQNIFAYITTMSEVINRVKQTKMNSE